MKTEANEYAFPCFDGSVFIKLGLTKREYFAAVAMQGLMSCIGSGLYCNGDCHAQKYASDAVVMADALIDELNKDSDGSNNNS